MFRHPPVSRLGLALVFAAATACGDANLLPPAQLGVRDDTVTLWALTGTSIQLPSAYDVVLGTVARTDRTPDFDLAFDFVYDSLKHDTVAAFMPRGALGLSADGGLLQVATRFDSLYAAPGSGYDAYKTVFLDTTTVVVVRSRTQVCNFGISSGYYAKIRPLTISRTYRNIIMRLVTDPNCGYHSLQPGIPGS
jgi:hypothetical protein